MYGFYTLYTALPINLNKEKKLTELIGQTLSEITHLFGM